jgi:hypothetical protein
VLQADGLSLEKFRSAPLARKDAGGLVFHRGTAAPAAQRGKIICGGLMLMVWRAVATALVTEWVGAFKESRFTFFLKPTMFCVQLLWAMA